MLGTTRLLSTAAALAATMVLSLGLATHPVPAVAQSSDAEQQIQSVVEGFNYGMVDATAQRDPTIIRDYLTDEFYQAMVVEMRADWAAGLAATDLVDLEWGTISVQDDEATAYTVETWSLTGTDGSGGELPPEINLYRLVLQDGAWKIDANEHPNSQF